MIISEKEWIKYRNKLSAINKKAENEFIAWIEAHGGWEALERNDVIEHAYALATRYGEASGALSAVMYDETAALSGVSVPAAEVAETATYQEVAKAINGAAKTSTSSNYLGGVVNQLVKQTGADTTLKNARRDGAEFAWIPAGETCAYCLSIAANGWKKASSKNIGHADHIHNNCDCTFAVRFDSSSNVKGYDPSKYKSLYNNADGSSSKEKINSIRREQYSDNKDEINAQKRIAYAKRIEDEE